jgi:2'-5' RNA ligase
MSLAEAESALVVLAPEAEGVVKAYRDAHDPAAALGVPAHVTVLYPFLLPEVPPPAAARLAALFAACAPFDYTLTELRRFPGVLYLAPEPAEAFRVLTQRVSQAFPDFPPYGGRHPHIIPHLTIAQLQDQARLDAVAAHFHATCSGLLPLRLRAEAVALLVSRAGAWQVAAEFPLGQFPLGALPLGTFPLEA